MTKQLTTTNPATEEVINTYDVATNEQIKEKTKKAQNAHLDWRKDMDMKIFWQKIDT